jgi:phage-related protein
MKLQTLEEGRSAHVWAIADDQGDCQVLGMLAEVERDHATLAADMASLLLQYVPTYGIPWHDESRAGKLYNDEIFELKATKYVNKKKTVGLRVAFFLEPDTSAVVVCTHAFYKVAGKTPPGEVQLARAERERYLEAKRAGARELLGKQ